MSYDISYASIALKTSENRYQIILATASSNVWSYDNKYRPVDFHKYGEIRSREEVVSDLKTLLLEVVSKVQRDINNGEISRFKDSQPSTKQEIRKYAEKNFGYYTGIAVDGHTSTTTFQKFRALVLGAIDRRAFTIEQFSSICDFSINNRWYRYNDEAITRVDQPVKTTKEFQEVVGKIAAIQPDSRQCFSINLGYWGMSAKDAKDRVRRWCKAIFGEKQTTPRRRSWEVQQEIRKATHYVIKARFLYVHKITKTKYWPSANILSAKVFKTEAQAQKFLDKHSYWAKRENLKIHKVEK